MFQVSQPYLRFWPDPKHFIVKKKLCCGHKKYGSILSLRTISFSVLRDVPHPNFETFVSLVHSIFWRQAKTFVTEVGYVMNVYTKTSSDKTCIKMILLLLDHCILVFEFGTMLSSMAFEDWHVHFRLHWTIFRQEMQGQTNLSYFLLYAVFGLKWQKNSDA